MTKTIDQRGFVGFAEFLDTYGARGMQNWEPLKQAASAHLNLEQAKTLVSALQAWIATQEG